MAYKSLLDHNIMELWLFDTCNFKCGYCGLVDTGEVRDVSQLSPFRDRAYIDGIVRFFTDNRPGGRPWVLLLSGGEPFLMPEIDYFIGEMGKQGDSVAIYTNMSLPLAKRVSPENFQHIAYLQASFHPDWHAKSDNMDTFFANVEAVQNAEVPTLVRFVGSPLILELLEPLEGRCRDIGVSFFPTTLFNPEYPRSYLPEEKERLAAFMVGFSSLMQLDGGVNMTGKNCLAGDRLYSAKLHKGGDVTPCISAGAPVIGNIFENLLSPIMGYKECLKADKICSCDVHFQQAIVQDIDDSDEFASILEGKGRKCAADYPSWKSEHKIRTSDKQWVGQGVSMSGLQGLVRYFRRK